VTYESYLTEYNLSKKLKTSKASTTNRGSVEGTGKRQKRSNILLVGDAKREQTIKDDYARVLRGEKRKARLQKNTSMYVSRKKRSLGFWCTVPGCELHCKSLRGFRRHMALGKHTGGVTHFTGSKTAIRTRGTALDEMKKLGANTASTITSAVVTNDSTTELTTSTHRSYKLIDGTIFEVKARLSGYARKPSRGGARKYTKAQLGFIAWAFEQGLRHKENKISPDAAQSLMKMIGTEAGARMKFPNDPYWKPTANGLPLFEEVELLEHWTFRTWFSSLKNDFQTKMANAQLKAVDMVNLTDVQAGDDDIDGE